MKTCPHCAESDLQDDAKICKHCGKKIDKGWGCGKDMAILCVIICVIGGFFFWPMWILGVVFLIVATSGKD